MAAKKNNKIQVLIFVCAALVLLAMALSVLSSRAAYPLSSLNTLLIGAGAAAVLYLAAALWGGKMPEMLRDLLLLGAVAGASLAMCMLIAGRSTLAGYVYFSDLESNNPVAVRAMNLGLCGVAGYLSAIVVTVIVGFMKRK